MNSKLDKFNRQSHITIHFWLNNFNISIIFYIHVCYEISFEKYISSNLTIMFKTWSMITNKPYSAQNEMISNRKVNCFVLKQLRLYITVALCSSIEIHFFLPVWLIYVLITRIKDPWKTNVRLQGNKKSSNLISFHQE